MPASPATPAAYLASLPAERREDLSALDRAIRKALSKVKPKLWPMMGKGLIGYGEFPYTYGDGREGTWFIIGLTNNKGHMSLYISASDEKGYLVEQNLHKLGKVKGGRSCINFKHLADLDLPAVLALVKQAARMRGMLGRPAQ